VQADASGSVDQLHVYVDSRSTSGMLVAGLYTDDAGHPGTLLAQQAVADPAGGEWNTVSLPDQTITAGKRYWLAVLGPGGTPAFRDRGDGGCSSETSASSSLAALPSTWQPGQDWDTCSISAYASR
jgi:hypothetical protein